MEHTIETLSAKLAEMVEKGAKLEALNALAGTVTALTTRLEKAEQAVTTFSAELEKRDRLALVELAAREGKEIPLTAEQIEKTPIATLSAMIDKLRPTVPVKRLTPERVIEFQAEAVGEDEARAAKIRTLASEIQRRENVSWHAAWSRASAQVGPAAGKK